MLWGNRHYISGTDFGVVDNDTYYGIGLSFTCFTACIATAVGFYITLDANDEANYNVGIKYLDTDGLPIGDKTTGWVDGEYESVGIDPQGDNMWISVTSETGWSLKKDSAYAICVMGDDATNEDYISVVYSTPQTYVKIYSGSSDPSKGVHKCDGSYEWSTITNANPIYYIKGKIDDVDAAYQDGCCYTSTTSANLALIRAEGAGLWARQKFYIDTTTYGYNPVLTDVYLRIRGESSLQGLTYRIYDSSDSLLTTHEIFDGSEYSASNSMDWSTEVIGFLTPTAIGLTSGHGQVYYLVWHPDSLSVNRYIEAIQGTTVGVSEYGFYHGVNRTDHWGTVETSDDEMSTWIAPNGDGCSAPMMFNILTIKGSVLGYNETKVDDEIQYTAPLFGLSVATVSGFNNIVTTDTTGSYELIVNSTAGDDNTLDFSFFHFQMNPNTISYGEIDQWRYISTVAQNSIKDFDEKWWGYEDDDQGKHYAFREVVSFEDSHSAYASGYVHDQAFQSGHMSVIYSSAESNEGVHLSADHAQIIYHNSKTYMAFRSQDSKAIITEYNHVTNSYGSKIDLGYISGSGYSQDTHYQPTLLIDADGYIWCFFSVHGSTIRYRKSDVPESIDDGWGELTDVPAFTDTYDGTYLRPRLNPVTGDIWLLCRESINDSRIILTKFDYIDQEWLIPEFWISSFYRNDGTAEGWRFKDKSVYIGGFRFDDNGYAYIALTYLEGMGGTPQHEVANQCFYTPDLSPTCKFYSIDGVEVSNLADNIGRSEWLNWNTLLTTCSLNFYTNTSDPATGITYPKGGTNEDHLQFLDGSFDNGTHIIKAPAILWTKKFSSIGYPSYPVLTYWSTAISHWVDRYVCSALAGEAEYWQASPRLSGGFSIDGENIAHYYGFFEPKTDTASWNTDYSGFPFIHYKTNVDLSHDFTEVVDDVSGSMEWSGETEAVKILSDVSGSRKVVLSYTIDWNGDRTHQVGGEVFVYTSGSEWKSVGNFSQTSDSDQSIQYETAFVSDFIIGATQVKIVWDENRGLDYPQSRFVLQNARKEYDSTRFVLKTKTILTVYSRFVLKFYRIFESSKRFVLSNYNTNTYLAVNHTFNATDDLYDVDIHLVTGNNVLIRYTVNWSGGAQTVRVVFWVRSSGTDFVGFADHSENTTDSIQYETVFVSDLIKTTYWARLEWGAETGGVPTVNWDDIEYYV